MPTVKAPAAEASGESDENGIGAVLCADERGEIDATEFQTARLQGAAVGAVDADRMTAGGSAHPFRSVPQCPKTRTNRVDETTQTGQSPR